MNFEKKTNALTNKLKLFNILKIKDVDKQKAKVAKLLIKSEKWLNWADTKTNMGLIDRILNNKEEYDKILKKIDIMSR